MAGNIVDRFRGAAHILYLFFGIIMVVLKQDGILNALKNITPNSLAVRSRYPHNRICGRKRIGHFHIIYFIQRGIDH